MGLLSTDIFCLLVIVIVQYREASLNIKFDLLHFICVLNVQRDQAVQTYDIVAVQPTNSDVFKVFDVLTLYCWQYSVDFLIVVWVWVKLENCHSEVC